MPNTKTLYKDDITNDQTQKQKFYYGRSDTPFWERYENHKNSFRHKESSTETDLAKYCWELKDKGAVLQLIFPLLNVSKINHLLTVVAYALVKSFL